MSNNISFTGRRRARRYALQALYGWFLTKNPLKDIEQYALSEHRSGALDGAYFHDLLQGVATHVDELDARIMYHLSTRKLNDLDLIERTLLRIAFYELTQQPTVPYRVVINEALELAKAFGSPESYKFINGVLDSFVKMTLPKEV